MCDKVGFKLCRLCLNTNGELNNVFDERRTLEFMLGKTIEDLIDVKVLEDANYPWLVCSNCTDKLTDFRLFKRRCVECLFFFYNRIQKECNPETKEWMPNREDVPNETDKEVVDIPVASDAIDCNVVDVQDDMNVVKEDIDATSECHVATEIDSGSSMVASMLESNSHCSGNEDSGSLLTSGINKEADNDITGSHAVDVQDDMVFVKEEIDTATGFSIALGKDIDVQIGTSTLEGDSHCSGNDEAGNGFSDDIKEEFTDNNIVSDATDRAVDAKEEMLLVDEDINIASGHCVSSEMDEDLSLGASTQEAQSYNTDSEDSGNLEHSEDIELHLSSDEEVDNKTVCDAAIPQKEEGLGEVFQAQDECQGQNGAGASWWNLRHTCQICSKAFRARALLKDHVVTVHLKKKMQCRCDNCSESFANKSDLQRHVAMLHTMKPEHEVNKNHHCRHCSRQFQNKSELRMHMAAHGGETSFECTICSKTFTQICNLKSHMLTHTGEKPYKCYLCPKSFTVKSNLKMHMLTHTGERPHKCGVCSKSFIQKINLKCHMLTHTGDRPHKCQVCSNAFALSSTLKRHMLSHIGEKSHKCEICCKSFTHKSYLKVHSLTHSNERQHKCVVCFKAYKCKSTLIQHKKVHKKVDTK